MSRTDAVEALYQDMAARHRSRFRSIHVRWTIRHCLSTTNNKNYRSSRLLSSRRPTMSSAHTSSNSSPRTSSSLFLTVSPRQTVPRSSLASAHQLSTKRVLAMWGFRMVWGGSALHYSCYSSLCSIGRIMSTKCIWSIHWRFHRVWFAIVTWRFMCNQLWTVFVRNSSWNGEFMIDEVFVSILTLFTLTQEYWEK